MVFIDGSKASLSLRLGIYADASVPELLSGIILASYGGHGRRCHSFSIEADRVLADEVPSQGDIHQNPIGRRRICWVYVRDRHQGE